MKRFTLLTLSLLIAGVLSIIGVAGLTSAAPQSQFAGNLPPAIVNFAADIDAIPFADAEAGSSKTLLSWNTLNLSAGQRVELEARYLNGWETLRADDFDMLPSTGERQIIVKTPQNFAPPTYRLSILDAYDNVLDEYTLVIPYEKAEETPVIPAIDSFTSAVTSVEANALANGSAFVPVSWRVSNRLPHTHIVFEQLLTNGAVIPVELPRESLWIASASDGLLMPTLPPTGSPVTLRMRVIDSLNGQVYDEAQINLTVTGTVTAPTPIPAAQIVYFRTQGGIVPMPVGSITLEWQVRNAAYATIEWIDKSGAKAAVIFQPTTGVLPLDLNNLGVVNDKYQFWVTATDANARPLYDQWGYPVSIMLEVSAAAPAPIVIDVFNGSPSPVHFGEVVTLQWSVRNADVVHIRRINPQGQIGDVVGEGLPDSGSATFKLPDVTAPEEYNDQVSFQLEAVTMTGQMQTAMVVIPIMVGDKPEFQIGAFDASPNPAASGGQVTINWQVDGVPVSVRIDRIVPEGGLLTLTDKAPMTGSLTDTLPEGFLGEVQYTITASAPNGMVDSRTVIVSAVVF